VIALLAILAGNGLIAFGQSGTAPAVDAFDPATGAMRQLVLGSAPAWSPDGLRLAYARNGQIYVANADGTGETAVGAGSDPSWSPDGSALAVARADGLGIQQIYVLRLADGTATQLTFGTTNGLLPAWSPDGQTIVFDTQSTLDAVSAQGGTVRAIPLPVSTNGGATWSPGGDLFAFVAGNGQVWVARADGSGAHQVTYTLVGASATPDRPAWSPDGGQIAWTQGADLCTTDLSGAVRRLTFTPQTSQAVVGSLPGWQPRAQPSSPIVAPSAGAASAIGCDWNPGVRIEMLDTNVSTNAVALKATQQLVFVNHTAQALTVSTTLHAAPATIEPGGFFGFKTEPGSYEFAVSGYPDGVPRRGMFDVAAAGSATIDAHAPIRYGTRTLLTGTARGPAGGKVTIATQAAGAGSFTTIATVAPAGGRWRLSVAPRITSRYRITFAGATTDRLLRVMPDLRVARAGATVRVSVKPAASLVGQAVFLFRLGAAGGWSQFTTARLGRSGVIVLRSLPTGRYYVGFQGGDRYWSTATEPFSIGR
jgi:dipeptidyl aminopeptidase/acylaminoacyl peptidase